MALALMAIGFMLPARVRRAYVALLFGLGIVLWIQASFLFPDYGPLDGAGINWAIESWRTPYEIALWITLPALCLAGATYVAPVAPFASGALVFAQTAALIASAAQADSRTTAEWKGPADSMFELSRKQDIIHIVLDAFQSEFFHEILEEERRTLDRSLSGALLFSDHAGAFPTTMVSIPAMLTGTVYRMERLLPRYVREHFDNGSLFKSLRTAGYRVDSVAEIPYDSKSATNVYRVPRQYVSYVEYKEFVAWQLADLSLFRHAPHILRPKIYNNQAWRLQTTFGPGDTSERRHFPVNGAAILEEFSHSLTPSVDEPLYKFIHVGLPHRPVTLDARYNYADGVRPTRENYKDQTRCAVRRVVAILDRLQVVGVYDDALIVITSDHGIGFAPPNFRNNSQTPAGVLATLSWKSMALLIVKAPGSLGPVRVSSAPTAISDVAATVLDAIDVPHALPGEPALKLREDASRVRTFAMYDWEDDGWKHNYLDTLDVMEILGRLLDGNSWSLKDSLYPPDAGADARTRGLYQTQRSRSGFVYRWSSPNAFFHAPEHSRGFEMKIRSIAPTPKTVTVAAEGRVLQTLILADQSWITVRHPLPPPANPATAWVELSVTPSWRPRGETRVLGVQTRDLKWTP